MKAFVLVNVHAGKSPEVVSHLRKIEGVKMAPACWGRGRDSHSGFSFAVWFSAHHSVYSHRWQKTL